MNQPLKKFWRRFRVTQPFNFLATGFLRAAGLRSIFLAEHLPRMGSFSQKLPNHRTFSLHSHGDDALVNQVYWQGWEKYEPEMSGLFFRMAERSQCTIDIGAHVGFYAILAGHANPKAKVYALEPLKIVFERLKENVALNHLTQVHCYPMAASHTEGTGDFYHAVSIDAPSNSSLSPVLMHAKYGEFTSTKVPLTTLDTLVKEHAITQVDLLKLDTEGTEPQIFRGAMGVLERDHPDIICEVLPELKTGLELGPLLKPLGYQFYWITEKGLIRTEEITGKWDYWNYLFTVRDINQIQRW